MMKNDWEDDLYQLLIKYSVSFLPFVPDAGHAALISKAEKGNEITTIVLSTEEEGVAFSCGAWLGGEKSVLLMQSSGVGNCINMMSLIANCNFPFVTLITRVWRSIRTGRKTQHRRQGRGPVFQQKLRRKEW